MLKPLQLLFQNSISFSNYRIFFLLLLLSITLRCIFLYQSIDNPLLYVPLLDEKYYVDYANWLNGHNTGGEVQFFFMDPLYAYFLSILFTLFDNNFFLVRIVQILLDSVNVILLFWIGSHLWSRWSGIVAALLYAFYPLAWFYSLTLLKTNLTTLLLTIFVSLFLLVLEKKQVALLFFLGILSGFAILLRGNLVLLIPLSLILLFVYVYMEKILLPRHLFLYLLGCIVSTTLIGANSYLKTKEFKVLPATGGTTLYSSNNPDNPGRGYSPPQFVTVNNPSELEQQYLNEAERRLGTSISKAESASYWRNEAIKYIFSSPKVFISIIFNKIKDLIGHSEIPNNQSFAIATSFTPLVSSSFPYYALILALGIPGLILGILCNRLSAVILLPIGVVVITSIIFYSSSRFRFPMVPMLILGSGFLITNIFKLHFNHFKKVFLGISIIVIFAISINIQKDNSKDIFLKLNLSRAYAETGRIEKAKSIIEQILKRNEKLPKAHAMYAYVLLIDKDFSLSLKHYLKALTHMPNNINYLRNAGVAARMSNNEDLANSFFQKAYKLTQDPAFLNLQAGVNSKQKIDRTMNKAGYGAKLQGEINK